MENIYNEQIKSLYEIIDKQNIELARLRGLSKQLEEFNNKNNELEKLIREYGLLCYEARKSIKEQKQLNKELNETIKSCKLDFHDAIDAECHRTLVTSVMS